MNGYVVVRTLCAKCLKRIGSSTNPCCCPKPEPKRVELHRMAPQPRYAPPYEPRQEVRTYVS